MLPTGNLYPKGGNRPKRVEKPSAAVWKSLPKQRKSAEKVEIPDATVRKSLPKQRKSAEKVEIPTTAVRKSLPKQRKSVEKVEIPSGAVRKSLPKQRKCAKKVEIPMCQPVRRLTSPPIRRLTSAARGLEISTQMVNNTLSIQFLFCEIVKDKTFISVKHHSDTPFIYK